MTEQHVKERMELGGPGPALLWTRLCDLRPPLSSGSVFLHLNEMKCLCTCLTASSKMTSPNGKHIFGKV